MRPRNSPQSHGGAEKAFRAELTEALAEFGWAVRKIIRRCRAILQKDWRHLGNMRFSTIFFIMSYIVM